MPLGNPFGYAMGGKAGPSDSPGPKGGAQKGNPFQTFGDYLLSKKSPDAAARKQRVRQTAEAQYNALHERIAAKRKAGPMQAQTSGMAQQTFAQAPDAQDAVGPMQSILEQGMSAPKMEG